MKNVVQDLTSAGLDWDREKWRGSVASKFIRGGEKNAVKYADEIIVLSKDVQKYFLELSHILACSGRSRGERESAAATTIQPGGVVPISTSPLFT